MPRPGSARTPVGAPADSFFAEVDTVVSSFPGFTEMKRSLRDMPQLRAPNVGDGAVGVPLARARR